LKIVDCYAAGSVNVLYCEDYDPLDYGNISAGGLIGLTNSSNEIINCHATGDVNGFMNVGGLVGLYTSCYYAKITNCYTTGAVSGYSEVGGLVGKNCGILDTCYATGDVNGYSEVGGLIGENYGVLDGCHATGAVNGFDSGESKSDNIGGLVGNYVSGNIKNCYATGNVNGSNHTGGLLGYSERGGIFEDCNATGDVNGNNYVGGLVGCFNPYSGVKVINCYATGDVDGNDCVGGLVGCWDSFGFSFGSEGMANCYATGNVNGSYYVGGLGGKGIQGSLNCYATGDVNGIDYVGGFAGALDREIYNCYSTGKINYDDDANNVGGFAGFGYCVECRRSVDNSFWDVETSGMSICVGNGYIDGELSTALDIQGKTTAQMKSKGTFVGADWDFINIWGIGENQTYPYLRQYSAVDINADGAVNFVDFAILANNWLMEK